VPWVVDGNNVAGGRGRGEVRAAALALARAERVRLLIFFDGAPPPGATAVETLGAVEVRYTPDADRAILAHLSGHGRGSRVATDDAELARRARALGAEVVGGAAFWRKVAVGVAGGAGGQGPIRLEDELAFVTDPAHRLPQGARRVPRRRRPRRV